jgi:amino acid transporter
MTQQSTNPEVKLRRVLTLPDLVIYGIILIQPAAALPLFGHANNISEGHAVTTILVAMFGMVFTAFSYGRLANRYPTSGSAYTYVGRGLHLIPGFICGWCMIMDYILVPMLCTIFTSVTANHLLPFIPIEVWIFVFAAGFTALNLNGIKVTARANWVMMVLGSAVVFWFMAAAIRYVLIQNGLGGLLSVKPFYDPITFDWSVIGAGTALAALTYIGFDGLTTLAEEVENPRRNILVATVLTCVITGVWSGSQVFLSQLAWPDWASFTAGITDEAVRNNNLDTAIYTVADRVGGYSLDATLAFILWLGSVGSGVTGQVGAARLLYSMGRDEILPKKFFGHLDRKHAGPSYNIILIGSLALLGAYSLNYEECARLINFGAFLAFMGVNLASISEFYIRAPRSRRNLFRDFLPPAIGIVVSFWIWQSLPLKTFIVGGAWLLIGVTFLAIRTRGFRKDMKMIDFSETE